MELEKFLEIRKTMCTENPMVTEGKMMHLPAIHFNGKVFAFFSRRNKMVFKLGKDYLHDNPSVPLSEFSPFKNKKPLTGWYELDYDHHEQWESLTIKALELIKLQ